MKTPEDDQKNGLTPPRMPDVTRLNRNVVLVAGMGVAVVVLAVTHVVRSDPGSVARQAGTARVEAGTVADFLRKPPEADRDSPIPPPAYPESEQDGDSSTTQVGAAQPSTPSYGAQAVSEPISAPSGSLYTRDPREEAYERALHAGLRPHQSRRGTFPMDRRLIVSASGQELRDSQVDALSASDWLDRPGAEPAGGGPIAANIPTAFAGRPAAMPSDRHQEFLDAVAGDPEPTSYFRPSMTEPVSEYQIMAGTVLPAMLVTAMNSDMPGEILAQISRNTYDSRQEHLLIPRGTKVIGRYDNQVALGQSRVLIAWTRLIFPDGRSVPLPGLPTKDMRGASGVPSQVNNHYARLYGQAALLSIISAGAQLSQPQQSNILAAASPGQVAAGALGRELSDISMETIRRNMDVRPTLEVKAGTPFYIYLERDLVLDGPYLERRTVDSAASSHSSTSQSFTLNP